jgi:hypothetical protein
VFNITLVLAIRILISIGAEHLGPFAFSANSRWMHPIP